VKTFKDRNVSERTWLRPVQYVYSEMASGANHSRLTRTTYPYGRSVATVYAGGDRALRYVEANPLRAKLVERAEAWRWSSLCCRERGIGLCAMLDEWPVDHPADWLEIVNEPLPEEELARVHASVRKGRPLGADDWVASAARRLGLGHTLRGKGRPKKHAS
jgi:hypothetical protein